MGPYKHERTAPSIRILSETGTIKWNCSTVVNLECLFSILFNKKQIYKLKINFLKDKLKYPTGPYKYEMATS